MMFDTPFWGCPFGDLSRNTTLNFATMLLSVSLYSSYPCWKISSFLSSTIKNDFFGPVAFIFSSLAFSVTPWDKACAVAKDAPCLCVLPPTGQTTAKNIGSFFFNSCLSYLANSNWRFLWRSLFFYKTGLPCT